MGLFRRSRSLEDRFPPKRIGFLPGMLGAAAHHGAANAGMDRALILGSRFFAGYLMAYPTYLDGVDKHLGAKVRMILFASLYGRSAADEIYRATTGHLMLRDPQVTRGAGFGEPDGERYFQALEAGKDATDSIHSLQEALSGGFADPSQQISN